MTEGVVPGKSTATAGAKHGRRGGLTAVAGLIFMGQLWIPDAMPVLIPKISLPLQREIHGFTGAVI